MRAVLVLNMGMKSIRSFIFREDGRKLSGSALPLTSAINDQRVEQDAFEWWEKALQVMKKWQGSGCWMPSRSRLLPPAWSA